MRSSLRRSPLLWILILGLTAAAALQGAPKKRTGMIFTSSSFQDGQALPAQYTCLGENISPELHWSRVPPKTQSFAIICDDPDAPLKTWVHWVIYDIPAKADPSKDIFQLLEKFPKVEKTTTGIQQGTNDFNKIGWDGPCPPSGIHRYYFHLYALDGPTGLKAGANKAQLLKAMEGHILSQTQIMGTFQK